MSITAAKWNATNPPGTSVRVRRPNGTYLHTVVRSSAFDVPGMGLALVECQGIRECVPVSEVEPDDQVVRP